MIDALNTDKVEKPASALIGSTEERQALLLQQDKEFQESLNADKQKLHKVRIQQARAVRVDPKPDQWRSQDLKILQAYGRASAEGASCLCASAIGASVCRGVRHAPPGNF